MPKEMSASELLKALIALMDSPEESEGEPIRGYQRGTPLGRPMRGRPSAPLRQPAGHTGGPRTPPTAPGSSTAVTPGGSTAAGYAPAPRARATPAPGAPAAGGAGTVLSQQQRAASMLGIPVTQIQQGMSGAGGGGAAGGGPGGSGGPESTGLLGEYGAGLMDPGSAYSRRMQEELTGRIGEETEAQRRLAAFDAAQSGMGAGGSPELMAMLQDIGVGGQEALGGAMGDLMLESPRLGGEFLGAAQQGEIGYAGLDLEEQLGMGQLDLSRWQTGQASEAQQQQSEMESWYQGEQIRLEQERIAMAQEQAEFDMMQQEMMAGYGNGGGYAGGGGGGYPPPSYGGALG